ncbi:MAG: hypothetical protein EA423_07795 [Phycisphaerales bacterium]|nr:MAG: hypothetical protein EA423_07795 [Phycisphaerales bacterium]
MNARPSIIRRPSRRRAMTLLEVLLAIGIGAALAIGIGNFIGDLMSGRDRLLTSAEQFDSGNRMVEALERALSTTMVAGPGEEAGIDGTQESIVVLCRAVTVPDPARGLLAPGDLQRLELRFSAESGRVRASARDASLASAGTQPQIIAAGVRRLRLRYHDGSAWRSEFNTVQAGRLPVAVEIAVWFENGQPREPEFDAMPVEERPPPTRRPDRLRIIAIPDAAEGDA